MTFVAVLSLAIGMGASTAVFGLLDVVVLRPLPVFKPDRLVTPTLVLRQGAFDNFSFAQFREFRDTPALSAVSAWSAEHFDLQWAGQSETVPGIYFAPGYFGTLGLLPLAGAFPEGAAHATEIVIGYDFWKTRFHGSTGILGQPVEIQGLPFSIAAVAPRGFFGTEIGSQPNIFVPIAAQPSISHASPRVQSDAPWLKVVGRMSDNTNMAQLGRQLSTILQRHLMDVVRAAPAGTPERAKREFLQQRIEVVPAGDFSPVRRLFAEPLVILMTLTVMVLLVACSNTANLLLSRAMARRKEMAIRLASGASQGRLVRQLLVESLLLSTLGGIAGIALAPMLRRYLVSIFDTGHATVSLDNSMDGRFLLFALAAIVFTGLLFGLAPALRAARTDLASSLKGRTGDGGLGYARGGFSFGKILVSFQVAMSTCLLVGTGLFVRSLVNLKTVDMGFNPHRVIVTRIQPERAGIQHDRLGPFYSQLLDRVRSIPGVQSASLARFTPIQGSALTDEIEVDGFVPTPGERSRVSINYVGTQFFQTLGAKLLMGRDFDSSDAQRPAAIVSQSFVRRYFAARNPIGEHFRLAGPNGMRYEIVGVVGEMKYRDPREPAPLTVFYSALQNPSSLRQPQLSIRLDGRMKVSAEVIRTVLAGVGVPAGEITTLDRQIDASLVQERLMASVAAVLGVFALVLTCVGVYGVVSYSTSRRTIEIGIRIALGAQPYSVVASIVRQTALTVAAGILGGLPASLLAVRFIRVGLFGVAALDPLTIASTVSLMIAVGVAAGYVPALRATRVDPLVALRSE
jgi:predicted permease